MSVKNFDEILNNAITVLVDNEFEVKIVSLSGLFMLKMNAWVDRHNTTSKDAEDMYYIISNYHDVFESRNNEQNMHQEVYEMNDFDIVHKFTYLSSGMLGHLIYARLFHYDDS